MKTIQYANICPSQATSRAIRNGWVLDTAPNPSAGNVFLILKQIQINNCFFWELAYDL